MKLEGDILVWLEFYSFQLSPSITMPINFCEMLLTQGPVDHILSISFLEYAEYTKLPRQRLLMSQLREFV
jgi:hypothetical protein